jgi:hypothetical protein
MGARVRRRRGVGHPPPIIRSNEIGLIDGEFGQTGVNTWSFANRELKIHQFASNGIAGAQARVLTAS